MMSEENKDNLTETVENAAEQAQETVQDAVESVEETASDVAEQAQETVESAKETASDVAETAQEMAQDAVESVEETASDVAETAQETVQDAVESVEETASDVAEQAQETVQDAVESVEETVNDVVSDASPNDLALASLQAEQVNTGTDEHHDEAHHYTDAVTLPIINRTVTVNGGIYTVIFGVLAAITVIEVISAELFPEGALRVGILMGLSVAKALLVIYFYMHLKSDNPLFRLVLGLPMVIVIISLLFLIVAPYAGGYLSSPV